MLHSNIFFQKQPKIVEFNFKYVYIDTCLIMAKLPKGSDAKLLAYSSYIRGRVAESPSECSSF